MDDLKELIRQAAEDLVPDSRLPEPVARRARRRRATNGALAGLLAVSLLAVAGLGIRAAVGVAPPPPPRPGQGTVQDAPWEGVWPHDTRQEAEAAQARVDAGDPELGWLLEVEAFLERYGTDELGWSLVAFDDSLDVSEADESGPLTITIADCDDRAGVSVCKGARIAEVTVERLLRRDRTGIWSVTSATLEHGGPPLVQEMQVRDVAAAFMSARIRGSGADEFLSPEAKAEFERGADGLSLYGPPSGPRYEAFEVIDVRPSELDSNYFEITVRIVEESAGQGEAGSFEEIFGVGPDGRGGLWVHFAARTPSSEPAG